MPVVRRFPWLGVAGACGAGTGILLTISATAVAGKKSPSHGASIKHGHVTASLLVQRLRAHPNRSQLARALQEYGRIIKTRFILRYHNPDLRRLQLVKLD